MQTEDNIFIGSAEPGMDRGVTWTEGYQLAQTAWLSWETWVGVFALCSEACDSLIPVSASGWASASGWLHM
jgi:hypothetical protein